MSYNKKKHYNIGIDIGGTKIAIGLVDNEIRLIDRIDIPTVIEKGPDPLISEIIKQTGTLINRNGLIDKQVNSIGIGVPGTVDHETGHVVLAPNIYWRDVPLGKKFTESFTSTPIYIDQDTNAAILGEYMLQDGKYIKNFFYITLGTGVGSGLIFNGKLYRGRLNTAGEIGHTVVEKNGIPCTCGNRGCLQMYAKGPGIVDEAIRRIERGAETNLKKYLEEKNKLTAQQIGDEANNGDKFAMDLLLWAADYVGLALANIVSVLNPDLIVIGGGVTRCGAFFINAITNSTIKYCYPPARDSVVISCTTQWEKSGIIGAALLYSSF